MIGFSGAQRNPVMQDQSHPIQIVHERPRDADRFQEDPNHPVMRLLANVLERRGRLADLESLGSILVTRHWIENEDQLLQLDRGTWVAMGLPFAVRLPATHNCH